ncbi:papilin-like [Magallana gigas]|uniref:papilin-like n=1 Tax=Magallana gigas TaxID=29159 RepID=UPI003340BDFA
MGSYLCVANNGVSNPAQRIVILHLRESLRASIEQVEERKREGETLYLTCSGFGYPTPSITWEKNGLPLTSDQRIKIQGGCLSFRVRNLALEDTGTYTCIVMNDEEKVEDTVSIQVTPFDLLSSTCVDSASKVKCSLIVAARLCGHTRYSRPCCESCQREKTRIMQRSSPILG